MSKTGARLALMVAWALGAGGCAAILGIEEQTFDGGTDAGDKGAGQDATTSESSGSSSGGSSGSASGSISSSSGAAGSGGVSGNSGTSRTSGAGGSTSGETGSSGAGGSGTGLPGRCLDGITDYEDAGPFTYTATSSGSVKMWVPAVPAGCKVPVIHLANGTTATCSSYQDVLNRLASHGFLTTCYEDPNTGAGTQAITAFTTAIAMYPDLADNKLGSTGHSQGGQAAFTALQLAEAKWGSSYIYAGLAMEPASGFGTQPVADGGWQQVYGEIKSPMFMFDGTADMLVSAAWVGQAYSAMNPMNEVYWWSATGATHIPVPQVPAEQVSIPWFRWKLLGDNAACRFFKAIPGNAMINPGWTKQMSENEAPCQ